MKLLLDTHIWLWIHLEPERLGERLNRVLREPSNDVYLSSVSVWEARLLLEKGRLKVPGDAGAWLKRAWSSLQQVALTHEIALASFALDTSHSDPADRFLAATALVMDLTLVTADAKLLAVPGIRTLANV